MPPKTKADEPAVDPTPDPAPSDGAPPETGPEVETPAAGPTHTAQLCNECGLLPIDESMTHFACAHGSWDLTG